MTLLGLTEGDNPNYNKRTMIDRLTGNAKHDRLMIKHPWQNKTMMVRAHESQKQAVEPIDILDYIKVFIIECY